jgi:hypothetical protein
MSDKGNEAGVLWDHILASALEESNFGIVCLTPSNLESRWLNFEAGALSKAVTQARVVPLLYGLTDKDVGLPLSRFMMKTADKEGLWDTIVAMNDHVEEDRRLKEPVLFGTFESLWPKLEEKLNAVASGPEARKRDDRELLEEILELTRNIGFIRARRSASTSEHLAEPPAIPPKIIDRLREVAGPGGYVETGGAVLTVYSPRVGTDYFSASELMFLDTTREFLGARYLTLKVVDAPPDIP